ncbi:hypothetical protein C8R44DRAFT_872752 [Mycena epipterygia]|nr:hypothetical protein C8R44DRAFT_872752 [Mycena epipterygia]
MDKATRTLGQVVPPELIFPPDHVPTHSRGRSSSSRPNLPASIPDLHIMSTSVTEYSEPTSIAPRKYIFPKRSASNASTYDRRPYPGLPASPRPQNASPLHVRNLGTTNLQRNEAGWSGEWNDDMDQIIKRLRELKQ